MSEERRLLPRIVTVVRICLLLLALSARNLRHGFDEGDLELKHSYVDVTDYSIVHLPCSATQWFVKSAEVGT